MLWFIPLEVEDPFAANKRKVPLVNALLIIVNVLAFWVDWKPVCGRETELSSTLFYAFGHADETHLIGNMWFLAVFGSPVNRRLGNSLYLLAYLSSALFVGFWARLFAGEGIIGASGAVFAMETICAILFAGARIRIFYFSLFPITIPAGLLHRPQSAVDWFIRWDTFRAQALAWGLGLTLVLQIWHLAAWLRVGLWHWTYLGTCWESCGASRLS